MNHNGGNACGSTFRTLKALNKCKAILLPCNADAVIRKGYGQSISQETGTPKALSQKQLPAPPDLSALGKVFSKLRWKLKDVTRLLHDASYMHKNCVMVKKDIVNIESVLVSFLLL